MGLHLLDRPPAESAGGIEEASSRVESSHSRVLLQFEILLWNENVIIIHYFLFISSRIIIGR